MVTEYEFTTPNTPGNVLAQDTVVESEEEVEMEPELPVPAAPAEPIAPSFPVFPSTARDAEEWWESTMTLTSHPSEPRVPRVNHQMSFISNTELAGGRQALLIDPGSWGNLSGTPWARRTAVLAGRSGRTATQKRR